ncbi:hypothetical protein FC15_GL000409 [Lapidilactobacillus concavus DSM 17758]|uniref:Septum formation initiator n=1 Tax=Lapidilactobacillus concavus DSM 17758 TaxID=1423735 RepID=A0A0R1VSF6_9LACO|nr:septum formation initiator family protein [Lapidilactobacillus concavus]KRM08670.1 hypothetical protein FC15_GL000409 [Lapidilactobacillus concavus DSM 17758]GEL13109.1 dihydroorotate dehydrogenase [Lapidilactobacillus concavus]
MQQQIQSNGKVTSIGNRFAIETEQRQDDERYRKYLKRVHYRRLFVLLLILTIILVGFGTQIVREWHNNEQIQAAVLVQKHKLGQTQQKHDDLKIQVNQLNEKNYLEKLIRYKYDYSKKGEIVFTLPETNPSTNAKN